MLSTGASFGPPVAWSSINFVGSTANLIGDLNGDGNADLIALSANWIYVETSTGTSFSPPVAWSGTGMSGNIANFG